MSENLLKYAISIVLLKKKLVAMATIKNKTMTKRTAMVDLV